MQQSSVSYRSNRYSTESRRTSNIPPAAHTNIVQQKEIEDLEKKVDMILMHNNQLMEEIKKIKSENEDLHHQIKMMKLRQSDVRLSSVQNVQEVYFLKRELQMKCEEIQYLSRQNVLEKQDFTSKFEELSSILADVRANYHKVAAQKQEIQKKLLKLHQDRERQINRIKQQYQNEVYENSLKKQIQHKEQLRQKQHEHNQIIEKLKKSWEEEKLQLEEERMSALLNIQEKFEKEKQEIRKMVEEDFQQRMHKIQQQAEQKCRRIRDQSEAYIKNMLEQDRQSEQPDEELKKQIQSLKQSLEQRQKVIMNLLKFKSHPLTDASLYYKQVQDLRQRIKQLTEDFFQQSELLKVKMAVKHDIDVREMVRVYEDRIDTLTSHINFLQTDKKGLRERYEDQIRSKMKQRQKFEIQVSKLKNLIRKMKIQLESYGKQMRLNIEGIRDQANSFSMSILGELGQEKNKKTFYEEEIRKMRQVIDLKDNQMQTFIKQCEDKLLYNEERFKNAKKTIEDLSEQLEGKDQKFRQEFDNYKDLTRDQFEKEKHYWTQKTQQLKKQIADLHKQIDRQERAFKQSQAKNSSLEKDILKLNHELQSHKAHIESLKIEIEIAGQEPNLEQVTKPLKQHYQRIVDQLQHDKAILKQTNATQAQQMSKLVAKYKVLQKSMQKTLSSMKKKTVLEQKVTELGMDNNLVKNLQQVFRRSEEEKQNI